MSDAHYVLEILSAEGETTTRTIHQGSVVIGRREGEIVINDTGASGRHAEVRLVGSTVEVSDLGSTNGIVWDNGIEREAFTVRPGETFQIGRTKFTVTSIHVPEAEPEPVEVEPDEEEEATAFISAAELGMEDVQEKSNPEPEPAPEPEPEPEPVAAPEPEPVAAPQPAPVVAQPPPAAEPLPQPAAAEPALEEDEEDEEEATAWMSAMGPDDQPEEADVSSAGDGGWQDEPAPETLTIADDWQGDAPPTEAMPFDPSSAAHAHMEQSGTAQSLQMSELRPNFRGEGGELFKIFFLQGLLVAITFGIYMPWMICNFCRYMASHTVFGPTRRGWVYFRFHGTGGDLFVKFLIGYLLTMVTLGIYGAWFVCDMARWFLDRSDAVAEDGTIYQMQFDMNGGELFVTLLVNYLLTLVTLGIYGAWAYCKVRAQIMSHLHLFENSEHVGSFQFIAQGSALLPFFLVQSLLSMVTFGIYIPWALVKTMQFMNQHTRVYYRERWFQADFTGTGGSYFLLNLIGVLLTQLTFGIYFSWYFAKKQAFEIDHDVWTELT